MLDLDVQECHQHTSPGADGITSRTVNHRTGDAPEKSPPGRPAPRADGAKRLLRCAGQVLTPSSPRGISAQTAAPPQTTRNKTEQTGSAATLRLRLPPAGFISYG